MEGLVTVFWRLTPPTTVLPFYFLSRQLSLFWHKCESCCFNCTRHWQVYFLRAGVWCPQVSVPSRGHVGTSQMSSWLKENNSSVLYAQLHFVALGPNPIALPFRVSSLKDALILTEVFTESSSLCWKCHMRCAKVCDFTYCADKLDFCPAGFIFFSHSSPEDSTNGF